MTRSAVLLCFTASVCLLHVVTASAFDQTYLDDDVCRARCNVSSVNCWPSATAISNFRSLLNGTVYDATDPSYSKTYELKNKRITKEPALIVNATSSGDVQKSVLFARQYNLKIAVRSSGHSYVGRSTVEGGVLIDLYNMRDIQVNLTSSRNTAGEVTVESGNNWARVYEEVDKYGHRVVVGGSDHNVGMGGYTQGGGHSPVCRSLGLAVDNLLEATLVSADGRLVTVSADGTKIQEANGTVTESSDTDLFWALRGGGGGTWGIVTTFTFKLHDPPPGMVVFSASYPLIVHQGIPGSDVLKKIFKYTINMSQGWGGYILFNNYPTDLTGKNFGIITIYMNYYGTWSSAVQTEWNGMIASISQTPLTNTVTNKTSFWDYEKDVAPDTSDGRVYVFNTLTQDDSDYDGMVDTLMTQSISGPAEVLHGCTSSLIGGVIRNNPQEVTSITPYFRSGLHSLSCYLFWSDASKDAEATKAAIKYGDQLKQYGKGIYFNEPTQDINDWKEQFWGPNYARLLAIKKKWDPENLFTCQHCVGCDEDCESCHKPVSLDSAQSIIINWLVMMISLLPIFNIF
ncbi:uncharacterized FAD-linked oxidoreductase YvdP isoform X1 [Patella vulgata]|uniref:uncharacterized FAD-linked oxidoreductase YvdP isoform X1 n=1 Tax=Patella vulgata TaxID=6465 RepID=UPI00217F81E9|nr:uncharacterized FAD-linked oxidoreductase YvdP isoform X1 [Patella vulgata]